MTHGALQLLCVAERAGGRRLALVDAAARRALGRRRLRALGRQFARQRGVLRARGVQRAGQLVDERGVGPALVHVRAHAEHRQLVLQPLPVLGRSRSLVAALARCLLYTHS